MVVNNKDLMNNIILNDVDNNSNNISDYNSIVIHH